MNITSTSSTPNENHELIVPQDEALVKHLDAQWNMCFEQHEPPTDDMVVQVSMGDETNSKPIFISESLSYNKKEDLITFICEYTDVLA